MLPPPAPSELHRRHVVVLIDDEPCILAALKRLLRNEPYEFLATHVPEEAIHWVLEKHASLLMADQRMPGVTGLEILELVMKCSPSTVRVMLTGHSDLSGVLRTTKIEAIQRLIRKPWDAEELKRAIQDLLRQREQGTPADGPRISEG
jgi:response regulator RpfG family c-di-GMP phosphodiesterase